MLRERLGSFRVAMDVVYGNPTGTHAGRGDTVEPPWAIPIDHKNLGVGRYSLTWQPYIDVIRDADLVIAQQASRHLLNYVLLARQTFGGPRLAFWGHGRNFQASSAVQHVAEGVKRWLTQRSHWFFAYNDLSAEVLVNNGYPGDRITVVGNSIDTRALAAARDRVTAADLDALSTSLGLQGTHVGIFCGAMYAEKRLGFLVEAALEIRARIPDFELVCVGDGVDRPLIDHAAEEHDWIYPVGPQFGSSLASHFGLASVYLLPGVVGLTILDSFVFETPMITTSEAMHGPEIEYLHDGVNGLIVEGGSIDAYVDVVVDVLTDEERRQRLADGCRESAKQHSMEEMSERFALGVMLALSTD